MAGNEGAKGKTRQSQRTGRGRQRTPTLRLATKGLCNHRQHVLRLPAPLVVHTFTAAHAPES